jgi:hypothetical protein
LYGTFLLQRGFIRPWLNGRVVSPRLMTRDVEGKDAYQIAMLWSKDTLTHVCAALLLGQSATGGVHDLNVDVRLAALVGDWTLEGHEETYRELCEWFADRAFVVCRSADTADGSSGVSILGYSKSEQMFTYHHYDLHLGTKVRERRCSLD